MDLSECRKQIDAIDAELMKLLAQRMQVTDEVAAYKIRNHMPVLDREREKEKLSAVRKEWDDPFDRQAAEDVFSQIMAAGRKKQYRRMEEAGVLGEGAFEPIQTLRKDPTRVVVQGAEGSYSEAAMQAFFGAEEFGDSVQSFSVRTFRDAMTAIEEGAADYAVLPVENSTAGIVSETYDLLSEYENYIVGEQVVKVEHCLLAPAGVTTDSVRTVYAHPQSFLQSERFLFAHPEWELISMKNNAFAAAKVAEENRNDAAAIAGKQAAQRYGLSVLQEGIQDEKNNSTRFLIVTNRKVYVEGAGKISIVMELSHESGALYHALSHIMYNGLNMVKLESRPIEQRNWEYRFFLDFEGNLSDPAVRNALRGLREEAGSLRILGCYAGKGGNHEGE